MLYQTKKNISQLNRILAKRRKKFFHLFFLSLSLSLCILDTYFGTRTWITLSVNEQENNFSLVSISTLKKKFNFDDDLWFLILVFSKQASSLLLSLHTAVSIIAYYWSDFVFIFDIFFLLAWYFVSNIFFWWKFISFIHSFFCFFPFFPCLQKTFRISSIRTKIGSTSMLSIGRNI